MKNTKKIISKILIYFALILGVLFCLVPLYWMTEVTAEHSGSVYDAASLDSFQIYVGKLS